MVLHGVRIRVNAHICNALHLCNGEMYRDTPVWLDLTQINRIIMFQLADLNMKVIMKRGMTEGKKGSSGAPDRTELGKKRLIGNQRWRDINQDEKLINCYAVYRKVVPGVHLC